MNDDFISRQAAIEAVEPYTDDVYNSIAREIKAELRTLSSVQHKTGRFENYLGEDVGLVKCTACGYEYTDRLECTNFCGNCGAKMEGDGE